MEKLKYNTAISKLMILVNSIYEVGCSQEEWKKFLVMLSPFAPHIAEELWEKLGHTESIFKKSWPKYDSNKTIDEEIELVIQINGKVRDRVRVSADISEKEVNKLVLESEKIKNILQVKKLKRLFL